MKKWIAFSWLLLLGGIVCLFNDVPRAQVSLTGAGGSIRSGCSAVLALDGTPQTNSSGAATGSVTFSYTANDIVVAILATSSAADITSVSGGTGLSWLILPGFAANNNGNSATGWYAVAASSQTSQTISYSDGSASYMTVFAVSGANTSSPFDGNATKVSAEPSSITTTNANDFVFTWIFNTVASGFPDSTWTQIANVAFIASEYKIVSSTGTYTAAFNSTSGNVGSAAIKRSC